MTQSRAGIRVANGPRVAERLRNLIGSNDELSFPMEAHGGMSAVVTERAGSKGLRTSGLSISSLRGDRDTCEASWTQLVNVVERMADLTELPVLADGDSGFGQFQRRTSSGTRAAAARRWRRRARGVDGVPC